MYPDSERHSCDPRPKRGSVEVTPVQKNKFQLEQRCVHRFFLGDGTDVCCDGDEPSHFEIH